jgi:hypothetical protein
VKSALLAALLEGLVLLHLLHEALLVRLRLHRHRRSREHGHPSGDEQCCKPRHELPPRAAHECTIATGLCPACRAASRLTQV